MINKELRSIFNGKIAIKGGKYAKAQVYTLDGSSPDIKPQAPIDVKNGAARVQAAARCRRRCSSSTEPSLARRGRLRGLVVAVVGGLAADGADCMPAPPHGAGDRHERRPR